MLLVRGQNSRVSFFRSSVVQAGAYSTLSPSLPWLKTHRFAVGTMLEISIRSVGVSEIVACIVREYVLYVFFWKSKKNLTFYVFCFPSHVFSNYGSMILVILFSVISVMSVCVFLQMFLSLNTVTPGPLKITKVSGHEKKEAIRRPSSKMAI